MNAVVPIEKPAAIPQTFGLVPSSMGEAMQLAKMMADAKLVPAALQKSPADCLMVIQQAIRWQMDPFAVAQECSVIQGKLMHSGKLVAAVINARGGLAERLAFAYEGEGDNRTITVSGRVHGEVEPRTVTVKIKDARTANKVWTSQPDQQLMYHGSRVWARRHAPELMLGVYSPEEFDEPAPIQRRPSRPAPNVMLVETGHDPNTGEVIGHAEPSPPLTPAADRGPAPADVLQDSSAGAGEVLSLEESARAAARKGEKTFKKFYKPLGPSQRSAIANISEELRNLMNDADETVGNTETPGD